MKKLSLITGLLLVVFFGVSMVIRAVLPWDQVFDGQYVKFTSVDGYYYMRLVDNMVHNFPHYTSFDPYHIFPGGQVIGRLGLYYQAMAGFIWLVGLGNPGQQMVNTLAALFPPFLAALTVVPVYFIGRTLFNRWVGIIAAALIAVLPGEYLGRSILGFTDTPVIEVFLTATALAFLVLAVKAASDRGLGFSHFLRLEWRVFLRPAIYSLLAGFFIAAYMGSWAGGLLFVFIITLYLVVQFTIDHLAGRSTEYLGIVGFLLFLAAAIFYIPVSRGVYVTFSFIFALIIPVVLSAASRYMAARGIRPLYFPAAIFGLAVVLSGILWGAMPRVAESMFEAFRIFAPVGSTAATTMEMQPFLAPQGGFSTVVAWGNYTTSFFLFPPEWGFLRVIPGVGLIAFFVLAWLITGQPADGPQHLRLRVASIAMLATGILLLMINFTGGSSLAVLVPGLIILILFFVGFIWLLTRPGAGLRGLVLFFIWTVITLVLTLVQRRFAYYFVVNVALLSAFLSWQLVWWSGLRKAIERPAATPQVSRLKRNRKRRSETSAGSYRVIAGSVALVVFLVVFLPNIVKARDQAATPAFAPSDAWEESLTWMKDNTPEPLGDPEAYYRLFGLDYTYPASAYGVTAWWDYGYWITRTARRIPSANPSQEPGAIANVARLFLSRDGAEAADAMVDMQSDYIIGDYATATSKFWAVATWAGESPQKYMPTYYFRQGESFVSAQAYSVDYYLTTFVRLYNFGGKAVTQVKPTVLTFVEQVDNDGNVLRLATGREEFDSYEAAQEYVQQEGPSTHAIVGTSAFVSPVPLEAMPGFTLVHNSKRGVNTASAGSIPEVRIFEYNGQ